jgi:hypothetical protein
VAARLVLLTRHRASFDDATSQLLNDQAQCVYGDTPQTELATARDANEVAILNAFERLAQKA